MASRDYEEFIAALNAHALRYLEFGKVCVVEHLGLGLVQLHAGEELLGGDQRFGAQMVPMLKEFAVDVSGGSIARCSHYVADERPNEVAAALIAFLKDN